jgi:hypothetical protein
MLARSENRHRKPRINGSGEHSNICMQIFFLMAISGEFSMGRIDGHLQKMRGRVGYRSASVPQRRYLMRYLAINCNPHQPPQSGTRIHSRAHLLLRASFLSPPLLPRCSAHGRNTAAPSGIELRCSHENLYLPFHST